MEEIEKIIPNHEEICRHLMKLKRTFIAILNDICRDSSEANGSINTIKLSFLYYLQST